MTRQRHHTALQTFRRWLTRRTPAKSAFLLMLWFISIVGQARAGDLKVTTGYIVNRGLLQVKQGAENLPPSVEGIMEYAGGDQIVPATQYTHLVLSGTGTKTTSGGDFTVAGDLMIEAPVAVVIEPGSVITLQGTLQEQGYLTGSIRKTVNLSGSTVTSDFGAIGATIAWSGTEPGPTTVRRTSGVALSGSGNESIKRYYDVTPSVNAGLAGTLVFRYDDRELNGHDPATLELWRSVDDGATWRRQGGTVDPLLRIVTKTGVASFSRWTASDAAHPLGPLYYEGVPHALTPAGGNNQAAAAGTVLSPFVVTVSDGYGNPIPGVAVTFAIAGIPAGASGQSLSTSDAVTGSDGRASTTLTLGDREGTYSVSATSGSLEGSPLTFVATATLDVPPPVATTLRLISGNSQSGQVAAWLPQPFVLAVLDQYGSPMVGASIEFTIDSAPGGATGYALAETLVTTDEYGRAQTRLMLGTRAGEYRVSATVSSLPGVVLSFSATAVAGPAAQVAIVSGSDQTATVGTAAPVPLVIVVTDTCGNPVAGVGVQFGFAVVPWGATGHALADTMVVTDSEGRASTTVTLGSVMGVYEVAALVDSAEGGQALFTLLALAEAPTGPVAMMRVSGNGQSGPILTQLPDELAVMVYDAAGSGVPGVSVQFAIAEVPSGAVGHALASTAVTTDSLGRATVRLTLGSKVGRYVVTAQSAGLAGSPVSFTASAVAGPPAALAIGGGDDQTAPVLTGLPRPLVVSVTDAGGNPVSGVPVIFELLTAPAGASGMRLAPSATTTDSLGLVSVDLTLGDRVGWYTIAASSAALGGIPVVFRARAMAGAPARVLLVAGQDQVASVTSTLDTVLTVRVTDIGGNPIAGVPVNFELLDAPAGASGVGLAPSAATTDSLGLAGTTLTLGNMVGWYMIAASSGGLSGSPVIFRARATAGPPAALFAVAGSNQVAWTESTLDTALTVRVKDRTGNAIPGVTVQFAITGAPLYASGQRLSTHVAMTDSAGLASTSLTLGDLDGLYEITASVQGVTSLQMAARGVVIIGDANNDRDVNIADLTRMIDHLNRRLVFSRPDSARADVNKDGAIRLNDLLYVRDYLLAGVWSPDIPLDPFAISYSSPGSTAAAPQRGALSIDPAALAGEITLTRSGLRFTLNNTTPVKGIQIIVRLLRPITKSEEPVVLDRAQQMDLHVSFLEGELRIVAYNLENNPIVPGRGAVLLLPMRQADLEALNEAIAIFSVEEHQAVSVPLKFQAVGEDLCPAAFKLEQNYPNPFNDQTVIKFEVPQLPDRNARISLHVFNLLGETVKVLAAGEFEPGWYSVNWDGTDGRGNRVSSGTYFYRLVSSDFATAKGMILLK